MHGIIVLELKKFVTEKFSPDAWKATLDGAGKSGTIFLPTETCPDEDVIAVVSSACKVAKMDLQDVLYQFGHFIAPDLLKVYSSLVDPSWNTLGLLENTEKIIHTTVRVTTPGATPPQLVPTRTSDDTVEIIYKSPRKMCSLARGLIQGVADHYNEKIIIEENSCMLKGDPQCTIVTKSA